MSKLEENLIQNEVLPPIWFRYVDDVFSILKKKDIQTLLGTLNSLFPSIEFTFEVENNGSLPFLDVEVKRRQDGLIHFSIYRKPTHTDRFITKDSFHCGQHKKAAFHSMVNRLYNIPMDETDFLAETNYIKNTARINGFSSTFITKILQKHEKKKEFKKFTTLEPFSETKKYISVPFYPSITNHIKDALRKFNIDLAFSNNNTLKNKISIMKDKDEYLSNSGIYQIFCKNCPAVYIGQTARQLKTRFKEHVKHTQKGEVTKSSVAEHMTEENHEIDEEKTCFLKKVRNNWKLDAWESMFITNSNFPLMNTKEAPISSSLFYLTELQI